ncbi:hypothetical protein ACEF14_06340 [Weissella paramesenteroides]
MNLKQIQNISMLYAYVFNNVPKIVVRDKSNILFAANFVEYHDGSFWNGYTDDDGDTQSINIEQTLQKNAVKELKNAFWKEYRLPQVNRWPKWTNTRKLEIIIDFVNSHENELIDFDIQPSDIVLIESNQPLDVILLEPDDEFTIIGMQ